MSRSNLAALTPGTVIATRDHTADEIDLFLFSAACSLPHRIHYDAEFAQSEGLKTVPVHGPLQATWLTQLAAEWAAQNGADLATSTVRHQSSAYPHERLQASLVVVGVEPNPSDSGLEVVLDLSLTKEDGTVTTAGTAHVRLNNGDK